MGTFSRRSKVILTQEEKIKVWREMPYTRPVAEIVSMDFLLMNQVDGIPEKKKIQGIFPDLCIQPVDG